MKRSFWAVIATALLAMAISTACAQEIRHVARDDAKTLSSGVYLAGYYYQTYNGDGTVTVALDAIVNASSRTTGTLRLELWAVTGERPPRGTLPPGYRLGVGSDMPPLTPRTSYPNLTWNLRYAPPPDGTYWMILVLSESGLPGCAQSDNFCLQDTFRSSQPRTWVAGNAGNVPNFLSGLWWSSSESGWGIHFTQRRSIVFAAWYTYDAAGNPKWYVASSCTMPAPSVTSGSCNGVLYEVSGPTFFGSAFNSGARNVLVAGSLRLNFLDANSASMTYTIGSQTRTVAITRQPISPGSTPGVDYTDLWWNPDESGWGMAIAQQASVMFLAWYVYDSAGKPMWYVASNCTVSGTGCTGTLYRTTGPAFGPTFDSTQVHVFAVGSVTLDFSDPNNGTLSYMVDGVSGTKAITRQLF